MTDRISRLIPFLGDFLVLTDEPRPAEGVQISSGLSFKPVRGSGGEPLLFRASNGILKLHEVPYASFQIQSVRKLVQQVI
jgi:hypothetical protein